MVNEGFDADRNEEACLMTVCRADLVLKMNARDMHRLEIVQHRRSKSLDPETASGK